MHCRRGQCTNGKLEQHRGVLFHPSIKERHSLRWEEVVYRYNIYGSFGVAGEIESTHDQLPCVLGLAITYIGQLRSVRCHGKQIFWYHISLTIKPVLEVFEQKEEIIIQLSHLFDHQLICITNKKQTTKNKFLALHFSFTAITRSFQSLKIMKHFNKSVFGTLGTKKPRILRNYSLTSITGNEISEVRNHKKSLPRKF